MYFSNNSELHTSLQYVWWSSFPSSFATLVNFSSALTPKVCCKTSFEWCNANLRCMTRAWECNFGRGIGKSFALSSLRWAKTSLLVGSTEPPIFQWYEEVDEETRLGDIVFLICNIHDVDWFFIVPDDVVDLLRSCDRYHAFEDWYYWASDISLEFHICTSEPSVVVECHNVVGFDVPAQQRDMIVVSLYFFWPPCKCYSFLSAKALLVFPYNSSIILDNKIVGFGI